MQEREATEVFPGKYFVSYFPDQSGPCLGPNPGQVQGMWLFHHQEGMIPGVLEDRSMAILTTPCDGAGNDEMSADLEHH